MENITQLKEICQTQKRGKKLPIWFGYTLHRDISIYITKFFLMTFPRVKPDQITVMMLIISMIGMYFIYQGDFWSRVVGVTLVYLGFLLDKVDGEIARYKKIFSYRGIYLDEIYHMLVPPAFLFFFFSFLFTNEYLVVLLFFSVIFTMLNRYNRKVIDVMMGKVRNNENVFIEIKTPSFVKKVFNSPLLKIFGIVERFDLLIIFMIVSMFLDYVFNVNLYFYILLFYFIFSFIYFLRRTLIHFFTISAKMESQK